MRRIQLLILLAACSLGALAQTEVKQKVKVKNADGKIHLKVEKEVDGKLTTLEKVYNNKEELQNDPELEGLNLHVFDKLNNAIFITTDSEDSDHKVNISVDIDADHDPDTDHAVFFNSFSDDIEDLHDINVWIDGQGDKHITKNGEEINLEDGNTWTDKEGNEFTIKKVDGKVIISSGEGSKEGDRFEEGIIEFKIDEESGGEDHKVMMFNSGKGDTNNTFTVKVVSNIKIHLEDLEENDFTELEGVDAKSLKMDELNYYPNPNDGKFTLQFKADKRPTQVKISSIEGKSVYEETLQDFEGTYQNKIDLSSQKKGIYLLQIIQGNKASNKKIVVE